MFSTQFHSFDTLLIAITLLSSFSVAQSSTPSYTTIVQTNSCSSSSFTPSPSCSSLASTLTVTDTVTITLTKCPCNALTTLLTFSTPYTTPEATSTTTDSNSEPTSLSYADSSDFSPYMPCTPGSFICTSATTFWTCDINPSASWSWQYPRRVADGMQCTPAHAPLPGNQEQMPGVQSGYVREDAYTIAGVPALSTCDEDGQIICLDDGIQWALCSFGRSIAMGYVAPGTLCVNGEMVNAM